MCVFVNVCVHVCVGVMSGEVVALEAVNKLIDSWSSEWSGLSASHSVSKYEVSIYSLLPLLTPFSL